MTLLLTFGAFHCCLWGVASVVLFRFYLSSILSRSVHYSKPLFFAMVLRGVVSSPSPIPIQRLACTSIRTDAQRSAPELLLSISDRTQQL